MASFKKLKSGWQYRISYKDPVSGKYKQRSENGFSTKREAQIKAEEMKAKMESVTSYDDNITFVEFINQWYETYKKGKFKPSYDKEARTILKRVKQEFGPVKLKDIDKMIYQRFLNKLGTGRTTYTVRKYHIFIGECLREAFHEGLLRRDPTYKVKIHGTKKGKDENLFYLNYNETQKLIATLKNDHPKTKTTKYTILLALTTGLRYSEVLGLKWDDIDFEQKTLTVKRMFDQNVSKQFLEPKSESSKRTITLDDFTIAWLKKYKLKSQKVYPTYIFIDKTGNFTGVKVANDRLRKYCRKAGVKEVTFHKLRHTHCSILIYKGVNIKYISKRLGHATTQITYQIYGHILDELEQQENKKVDQIMADIVSN